MLAFSVDPDPGGDDDEPVHGHDVHFLSRLSRVQARQADYALSLYRDPELVRHLLAAGGAVANDQRIALALADGPDSPHVIVASSGAFVTCLGAGMAVHHPVIDYERVREIVGRVVDQRDRQRAYHSLGVDQLLHRLIYAGDTLSREDMRAISAWSPLALSTVVSESKTTLELIAGMREAIAKPKGRVGRRSELVKAHWELVWQLGHLALLFGRDGQSVLDSMEGRTRGRMARMIVSRPAFSLHVQPISLCGLWAAGQIGAPMLDGWREDFACKLDSNVITEIAVGASFIGARHPQLARAARALIEDVPVQWRCLATEVRATCERVFADPDAALASWRETGATLVAMETGGIAASQVSDHAAFARASQVIGDATDIARIAQALPWLARADVEDFCLPEADLQRTGRDRYARARGEDLASLALAEQPMSEPVRSEARVGRNDPCWCGSGTKSKRCCG